MFIQATLDKINSDRNYMFWALQFGGWLGVAVITFFTFTVWSAEVRVTHIEHILFQSLQGMILTWPLRRIFTAIWSWPIGLRMILSLALVAIVAALWTFTRIVSFMWLSNEEGVMAEFSSWYFGGFFIIACWAALYYNFKYYRMAQLEHDLALAASAEALEQRFIRLSAESVAIDAQLKMLRYQLNPHFLFNTLNAIYSLIKLKENQASQKMVQQLSRFLRYSLENDPSKPLTLSREIEALQLYLNIEKTRFTERLNLQFDIEETAQRALVPSLLLQPLVENAIKYAISPSELGGTIGVNASVIDATLCIEVWDTGPGIDGSTDELIQGCGIGLRNTMERLKAAYGENFSFELGKSSAGGLKISIKIPYHPLEADTDDDAICKSQLAT